MWTTAVVVTRRAAIRGTLERQRQPIAQCGSRWLSKLADSLSFQDPQSFYTPEQKQIMQRTKDLHASIMPLNEKVSECEV